MDAIDRGAPDYPNRLLELGVRAPPRLFLRGRGWVPEPVAVAIVGSRRASEAGRAWAFELARALAEAEVAVVSGGALGIDASAHRGALAGGGRTCVVLPTPVDQPSPRAHRALFEAILEAGGTLLSEYEKPLGRFTFMERNRIIAALSDLVVVVEARARSGTRHTAIAAAELGRSVVVKSWPAADPRGEGLVDLGAEPVDLADEVLGWLQGRRPVARSARGPAADPLVAALEGPSTLDALAERLDYSPRELSLRLLKLELTGAVERVGGRWRRRRG